MPGTPDPALAGDLNDPAVALRAQHGQDRLRHPQRAEEVGLHLGADLGLGQLLDHAEMAVARVVDHHVQRAEALGRLPYGGEHVRAVGDVEPQGQHGVAVPLGEGTQGARSRAVAAPGRPGRGRPRPTRGRTPSSSGNEPRLGQRPHLSSVAHLTVTVAWTALVEWLVLLPHGRSARSEEAADPRADPGLGAGAVRVARLPRHDHRRDRRARGRRDTDRHAALPRKEDLLFADDRSTRGHWPPASTPGPAPSSTSSASGCATRCTPSTNATPSQGRKPGETWVPARQTRHPDSRG